MHLFVRGLFDNHASLYGGGLAVGGTLAFGELDVEGISVDSLGASAFSVGGGGGLQVPLNGNGTAHFCPIVQATFLLGPNSVGGFTYAPSTRYREADYSFGGAVGFIANGTAHQVKIIPTASFVLTTEHSRFTTSAGVLLNSHSQSLGVFTLGVGVLIGREVTVTPTLSDVAGERGSWLNAGVRLAFALGGTRAAIVNRRPTPCAELNATDSTIYDTTQVSERPTIRTAPELLYPPMEHDLLIEGRVVLGVTVGSDGAPDTGSVEVLDRVEPGLDREAVRWIEGVTYWPACRDGRPVRVRIAQPVDFCIAGCRHRRF